MWNSKPRSLIGWHEFFTVEVNWTTGAQEAPQLKTRFMWNSFIAVVNKPIYATPGLKVYSLPFDGYP